MYDPLAKDNEEKSARFAEERLSALPIAADRVQRCINQVLATKNHEASTDSDTNYLADADLAILGHPADEYHRYAALVRKEYTYFPDPVYKPGRRKVLEHFLAMPAIYKTDYFRSRYEEQAKTNLRQELATLS